MSQDKTPKTRLWFFSLLFHALFFGGYLLLTLYTYTLRGFWQVLPAPFLALVGLLLSLEALKRLQGEPLLRWQKVLIQVLHCPGLFFMYAVFLGFFILMLGGFISPSHYANYPSPSKQRSVTIVSSNVTCTQNVYLNRGLIMQSVGSFQIGTAKCSSSARATIQWQPGETAIFWSYHDRQGIIPLPK